MATIKYVSAQYRSPSLEDHAANPLICALPPLMEPHLVTKVSKVQPQLFISENSSKSDKISLIKRLRHTVVPTLPYLEFYNEIYDLIVSGYEGRNPLKNKVIEWSYEIANPSTSYEKLESLKTTDGAEPTTQALIITGLSGMGKTKMKNAVLSGAFPNYIIHTKKDFDEIQIVYLSIEMPPNGAQTALLANIIQSIDDTISKVDNTNYLNQVTSKSGKLASIDTLKRVVASLCLKFHVGIILIDEFQNLNVASAAHYKETLQLFDSLSNILDIPMVKIGTTESIAPFRSQFRHCRRAGDLIELKPYTKNNNPKVENNFEGADWRLLVEAVIKHQVLEKHISYSDRLDQELFTLSCGIPYVLFRLWQKVQIEAIRSGHRTIYLKDIRKIYEKHFRLIKIALNSLRSKKTGRFQDLLNVSQLFDDGDVSQGLKHLKNIVNKDAFTGAAAADLKRSIENLELNEPLTAKQEIEFEKIKKRLNQNAQQIKPGQTLEHAPDDD